MRFEGIQSRQDIIEQPDIGKAVLEIHVVMPQGDCFIGMSD